MLKILKNKKGINDIHYLWTILAILFALGLIVPYIDNYFSNSSIDYNPENIEKEIGVKLPETPATAQDVSAKDLVGSVLSMFFWSFSVPAWINILILMPMRIIFYVLLWRLVRSGAG